MPLSSLDITPCFVLWMLISPLSDVSDFNQRLTYVDTRPLCPLHLHTLQVPIRGIQGPPHNGGNRLSGASWWPQPPNTQSHKRQEQEMRSGHPLRWKHLPPSVGETSHVFVLVSVIRGPKTSLWSIDLSSWGAGEYNFIFCVRTCFDNLLRLSKVFFGEVFFFLGGGVPRRILIPDKKNSFVSLASKLVVFLRNSKLKQNCHINTYIHIRPHKKKSTDKCQQQTRRRSILESIEGNQSMHEAWHECISNVWLTWRQMEWHCHHRTVHN